MIEFECNGTTHHEGCLCHELRRDATRDKLQGEIDNLLQNAQTAQEEIEVLHTLLREILLVVDGRLTQEDALAVITRLRAAAGASS